MATNSEKKPWRRASPFRLAVHQFHRTYRRPPEGMTWLELFKEVTARKQERENAFGRQFQWVALGAAALAASGLGDVLSIKTALFELSVPKVYLAFLLALLVGTSLLEALGTLLIGSYQTTIGKRIAHRHHNTAVLATPFSANSVWTNVFVDAFTSFMYPARYRVAQSLAGFLVLVPIALIYLGAYILVVLHTVGYLFGRQTAFMGGLFSVTALLSLLVAPVLFVIAFKSFPLKKNVSAIRWNFLYRLFKKHDQLPTNIERWL